MAVFGPIKDEFNEWIAKTHTGISLTPAQLESEKWVFYRGALAAYFIIDYALGDGNRDDYKKLHEDLVAFFKKGNNQWLQ